MATHGYYSTPHWKALRVAALKRDRWQCVVAGCKRQARIVDHIQTRPRSPDPTPADRLDNLRSLCATHDAQMKEHKGGARGGPRLIGVDDDGWPLA
jgi:hypothetical protein